MADVQRAYVRRVFDVPADAADELVAALGDAGTLGIEELAGADGTQRLVAYFPAGEAVDVALPAGARLVEETELPAEDWMAGYRAAAQPLAIGELLWVDPREPSAAESAVASALARVRKSTSSQVPPFSSHFRGTERHVPSPDVPAGRTLLRIPARSAFGTGSHASTRLALRLLERLPLAGATVLDVGTGSGILAIAAVALGARRAAAFDVDVAAALLAGQHVRLNGMSARICCWAGDIGALRTGAQFDVVAANALPHELRAEQRQIVDAVRLGGDLLVSGVPAEESEEVLASWLRDRSLRASIELVEEDWAARLLHRPLEHDDDDLCDDL
jgi:ribosomal protein L11 methyltransferase